MEPGGQSVKACRRSPRTEMDIFRQRLWLIFAAATAVLGLYTLLLMECPPYGACAESLKTRPWIAWAL